jgi:hypothetical protein
MFTPLTDHTCPKQRSAPGVERRSTSPPCSALHVARCVMVLTEHAEVSYESRDRMHGLWQTFCFLRSCNAQQWHDPSPGEHRDTSLDARTLSFCRPEVAPVAPPESLLKNLAFLLSRLSHTICNWIQRARKYWSLSDQPSRPEVPLQHRG